jgi:hypothetical protein
MTTLSTLGTIVATQHAPRDIESGVSLALYLNKALQQLLSLEIESKLHALASHVGM